MNRKNFKFAILAMAALPLIACSEDDDNTEETVINAQELPESAQSFITTFFPAAEYSRIEKNTVAENDGTVFEVNLNNNFEIDFTAEGSWIDVDGNDQELPQGIVPEIILTYITENYPDLFITGIDTEADSYQIDLSNDLDVHFDKDGNFVREDK